MNFLLVSFICCIIFGKSFTKDVEEVDDFKILKNDYDVQDDENVRAFVHPAPKSLPFEKRSAFNALRNNPPFPILSFDEVEDVEFNQDSDAEEIVEKVETQREKREALNDKSLVHTLNIQKNNKMNEEIKDTPDNSKFHGAQFLDE